jgi:hypothetical protein
LSLWRWHKERANLTIPSIIFKKLFLNQQDVALNASQQASTTSSNNLGSFLRPSFNFLHRAPFGLLSFLSSKSHHHRRQQSASSAMISSFSTLGPLLTRLSLAAPMFSVILQRDSIEIGGNLGQLSIGELPEGVKNDSLTWVPVRGYKESQGGIPPPSDAPNEIYPIAWEIPIDDVYLDGQILPRSTLASATVSNSALIDTVCCA